MSEIEDFPARVTELETARGRLLASTAKRDRVARGIRTAILRGDYADGAALSQGELAGQYSVSRQVVWHALVSLERQGHVSADGENRFHVNAYNVTRQLQLVQNRLERIERFLSRVLEIPGDDPDKLARRP